jgi:hypothetical protein
LPQLFKLATLHDAIAHRILKTLLAEWQNLYFKLLEQMGIEMLKMQ